jgi:hypothetical protein
MRRRTIDTDTDSDADTEGPLLLSHPPLVMR